MLNSKVIEGYKRINQRGLVDELSLDQAADSFARIVLAQLGSQPVCKTGVSMRIEGGKNPKPRLGKKTQYDKKY